MEKAFVYLVQYTKGKEKLNRFYACPENEHLMTDGCELHCQIKSFVQSSGLGKLEEIAEAVEKEILDDKNFLRITGDKANLDSYEGTAENIFPIEISE